MAAVDRDRADRPRVRIGVEGQHLVLVGIVRTIPCRDPVPRPIVGRETDPCLVAPFGVGVPARQDVGLGTLDSAPCGPDVTSWWSGLVRAPDGRAPMQ